MNDREGNDSSDANCGSNDGDGDNGGGDSDDSDWPPRETAFLCDGMLGSLVTYCRMCGYDTAYALDRDIEADDRLLEVAEREKRTLLTRDRQLAARTRTAGSGEGTEKKSDEHRFGVDGLLLESRDVTGQLRELRAAGYELTVTERPVRCGRCNAPLEAVGNGENTPAYAPSVDVEDVWRCIECEQCFWKGSHWESVERTLAEL
jgi:uncharacterized protein with PIN domain